MDLQVTKLEMSDIRMSPKNYRKTIDEKSIQELAENIRQFGLINPITVRPVEPTDEVVDGEVYTDERHYEIVCGERRFRACSLLKMEEDEKNVVRSAQKKKKFDQFQTIPCVVREMSDSEAFDAMVTENLLREDVDPFEESYAFVEMMKMGASIEDLAEKFGKSVSFIRKRIALGGVVDGIKKMYQEEKLSLSCVMYLSRIPTDKQEFALSEGYVRDGITERELKQVIEWRMQTELSRATFGMSEEVEGFPVCAACPNNTACQGKLFGEDVEHPKCMNKDCFKRKNIETIIQKAKKLPEGVNLTYRGELEPFLAERLKAEKIPAFDEWKQYKHWDGTDKPRANQYDNGVDDDEYKSDMAAYEAELEKAVSELPSVYGRVVRVCDYSGLNFEPMVLRFNLPEESCEGNGEKTASEGSNAPQMKDFRIVELEQKDKKNLEKMNENIIKDLRQRMTDSDYERYSKPLSDVEMRVFKALLFKACSIHQREDLSGESYTVLGKRNMLEREWTEAEFNRLMRGFICESVTDSNITYDMTKQECLKAVMKDKEFASYNVAVEKYETVYNRRKETIHKKMEEIQHESKVQN